MSSSVTLPSSRPSQNAWQIAQQASWSSIPNLFQNRCQRSAPQEELLEPSVPLDRGQTIILLGGIMPHEVAPTCAGQERIVAINCYRVQTAERPRFRSFFEFYADFNRVDGT